MLGIGKIEFSYNNNGQWRNGYFLGNLFNLAIIRENIVIFCRPLFLVFLRSPLLSLSGYLCCCICFCHSLCVCVALSLSLLATDTFGRQSMLSDSISIQATQQQNPSLKSNNNENNNSDSQRQIKNLAEPNTNNPTAMVKETGSGARATKKTRMYRSSSGNRIRTNWYKWYSHALSTARKHNSCKWQIIE